MPCLSAIAPVRKGRRALPADPNPAIQPTAPVKIHGGRIRDDWFITIGNIGPRRRPVIETATALPMRDGTNQITNSRLGTYVMVSVYELIDGS
jgi:hypothetical protein